MLLIVGQIAILHAFSLGANVSQVIPITNTYTVIAVVLGIFFLGERPSDLFGYFKIGGAVLTAFVSGILASCSFSNHQQP